MTSPRWWRGASAGCFVAMSVVMASVLGLDLLLGAVELAGKEDASLEQLWQQLSRDLPDRARRLLAECALIGALWHLGARAQHGELNALRVLGTSSFRICLMGAVPAGLFAALVLALAESGTSDRTAREHQLQWMPEDGLVVLDRGCGQPLRWWQIGADGPRAWGLAEEGCRAADGGWQLQRVRHWSAGEPQPAWQQQMQLASGAPPAAGQRINPRHLSLAHIWRSAQGLPPSRYRSALLLEFWHRLAAPLTIALLVLAAALLPLAMLRDSSPGARLLLALGLAMGFHMADAVVRVLGQNLGLPPPVTVAIPLFALAALYALLVRRYG